MDDDDVEEEPEEVDADHWGRDNEELNTCV